MPKKDALTDNLLKVAEELLEYPVHHYNDRAFLAKELIQVTLPHSNPRGKPQEWCRKNGNLTLSIRSGIKTDPKTGERVNIGLPYGTVPRLLLYWLNTEAKKSGSRKIELGDSLNSFLRELGLSPATGGGVRGDAYRVRQQMEKLFRSQISFEYATENYSSWLDMPIAPKGELWWDIKNPDQFGLFGSWIELGEDFYNAITASAVPLDLRILKVLKNSALALDVYSWSVYRSFSCYKRQKDFSISWKLLSEQIGSQYTETKDFKKYAKVAFEKVQALNPDFKYEQVYGGIKILPPARLLVTERG